ncbi:MAG: hypothetical protein HDR29_06270 [Lachnospiraceae bacterium]|nr:hypothetical protein [Lachnospiraceae bacterium]
MSTFFPDVLDKFLSPAFLEKVRKKFHYGETQVSEFQAVAEEMLPLMREEAFWVKKEFVVQSQHHIEGRNAKYESVVMSLGSGVDCLQESYSEKGMLSQSYMIEVLASELLMQGYDAYNRYIRENTDWHVARYHFFGSEEEFPLEMLPQLLNELTLKVTCNSAFCMMPKKSVAFISELTQDESVKCEAVCTGCNNIYCPNRTTDDHPAKKRMTEMTDMPLTYGYSRIFGRVR